MPRIQSQPAVLRDPGEWLTHRPRHSLCGAEPVSAPRPFLCWDIRLIRKTLWKNDVLEIIIVLDSSGKKKKNHYL